MRIRVLGVVASFLVLVPATARAADTQKAPYVFGAALKYCNALPSAKCSGTVSFETATGGLKQDLQIAAPLAPSRGVNVGLALIAGGLYLEEARRSVPISVTFKINSASAAAPSPVSAAATGSYSAVILGVGALLQACVNCIASAQKTIVSWGIPPAAPSTALPKPPALPPSAPKLSPIPPPVPTVGAPGTLGPTTITLKFNVTNGRSLVPQGLIGIGAYTLTYNLLGGRPAPTPAFAGPQQPMNDIGTSHTKADVVVLSISAG